MTLRHILLFTYFRLPYLFYKITGTGAFGRRGGRPAEIHSSPTINAVKAALFRHHVKQYHEASCSVATLVCIVNALMEVKLDGEAPLPITQMDILETVKTANWKQRMQKQGDNGKRGLPLPVLGEVVKGSLDAYNLSYRGIHVVQASKAPAKARDVKARLWQRLQAFEENGRCVIIAHFDQGALVPTYNIPHISPVGEFDRPTGKVTLLDVDPEQVTPYTITFETFYRALASNYHHVLRPFGFGSGGYVCIDL